MSYAASTNALTELLLRRVSEQQRLQEQLVSAIASSSADLNSLQPNKTSVFRSESLPMVRDLQQSSQLSNVQHLLPTAVEKTAQQQEMEKLLHNFNLIQQARQLSAFVPNQQQHMPIGRTASLNTSINAQTSNPPIFVAPQLPAQKMSQPQQPLLLQRPPLKATVSSPLSPLNSTANSLPASKPETGLRRTESTKRKLLKSSNSKDIEEPKSKNVATDSVSITGNDVNDEDRQQFICRFCNKVISLKYFGLV